MTASDIIAHRGLTFEELRSFGPLASLLDETGLRDILVNAHDRGGEVWIDRGQTNELIEELTPTPEQVRALAVSLIASGGRRIDELHPYANVRIGNGVRVHAVLAPIASAGTAISIRFPSTRQASFDELVQGGLCSARMANLLRRAVASQLNILVTGSTGSGKTTLLAALLGEADPRERIISIEDVQELQISHPHHVALEARQANSEGAGRVTLDELLMETLRMRPDRIVVGECRGAELVTLMTALNTGHDGGAGTMHANSVTDVPARLEALGLLGGLSPQALARQAASAFNLVVHLKRTESGHQVDAVASLRVDDQGVLQLSAHERAT